MKQRSAPGAARTSGRFGAALQAWRPALAAWLAAQSIVFGTAPAAAGSSARPAQYATPSAVPPRRVYLPFSPAEADWAGAAVFWLGVNEQGLPGRNYADVRVTYNAEALHVQVTVIDYYLWYAEQPAPSADLAQYDAVTLYLDTAHDRAGAPQPDDYQLTLGARAWSGSEPAYHRQARGTGDGWDASWQADWTDAMGMQWSDGGPNNNGGNIDFGWTGIFHIPFSTLGMAGPPAAGTLIGFGLALHDRDARPPNGGLPVQTWPEALSASAPPTWGELHFGAAAYQAPPAVAQGATLIRAASPADNTVEDTWTGGGGQCSGGHEGGSEINHGDDPGLFIGTETAPTHFPCFNKSFLRFSLDAVPRGKVILSATLTLHLWGGADPSQAQPSRVHLHAIRDPWAEMTLHWNNAPMAQENVSAAWLYPYSKPSIEWPGDPYTWDASKPVAEAYARGEPVNLALYGSDWAQHSSKYLTSSETGDWNVAGRPRLVVYWGQALSSLTKSVAPPVVAAGRAATVSLAFMGDGRALALADAIPAPLILPGVVQASTGAAVVDAAGRAVRWSGTPAAGQAVALVYTLSAPLGAAVALSATAVLSASGGVIASSSVVIIANPRGTWVPLARR